MKKGKGINTMIDKLKDMVNMEIENIKNFNYILVPKFRFGNASEVGQVPLWRGIQGEEKLKMKSPLEAELGGGKNK